MKCSAPLVALFLGNACFLIAQTPKPQTTSTSNSLKDYPKDQTGVLIEGTEWTEVLQDVPSKMRLKHGIAAAFTYGAVAARAVMEYDGQHAEIVVSAGRPVICICYINRIPGQPALVRLHSKKNSRELVGATAPIMGGSINEAAKSDFVEITVSKPESTVWLVRPKEALPPGEYALMLGTQNINIFPFSVVSAANAAPAQLRNTH